VTHISRSYRGTTFKILSFRHRRPRPTSICNSQPRTLRILSSTWKQRSSFIRGWSGRKKGRLVLRMNGNKSRIPILLSNRRCTLWSKHVSNLHAPGIAGWKAACARRLGLIQTRWYSDWKGEAKPFSSEIIVSWSTNMLALRQNCDGSKSLKKSVGSLSA
jgi:hypothetical protein